MEIKLKNRFVAGFIVALFTVPLSAVASGWVVPDPAKYPRVPANFIQIVVNVTNAILGLVAIGATLFIIIGGAQYLTSTGDEQKAKDGKLTIQYAVMGLVIAALAYAAVALIVAVMSS